MIDQMLCFVCETGWNTYLLQSSVNMSDLKYEQDATLAVKCLQSAVFRLWTVPLPGVYADP